ncbi:MAG: acyltransferase [Thermoanaerobaculia bacterium]
MTTPIIEVPVLSGPAQGTPSIAARSTTLDVLRAIAVLAVLGRHMAVCPPTLSPLLHGLTKIWNQGGWAGVDLFFVLSGFLISGLLFREHQKYGSVFLKNFFIRRGLKIYPPFLVLILVTVLVTVIRGHPVPLNGLLHELLFVQNYGVGLWNHTWSLGIEEHFYLLLPVALMLSLRMQNRAGRPFDWIPWAFAIVAALCLGLRLGTASWSAYHDRRHVFPTHLRIDSLFAGVLVSYGYHYHECRFRELSARLRRYLLPVAIVCFVPPFAFPIETTPFLYTFGFSFLWIGGALLLFCLAAPEERQGKGFRSLAFLGSRSYSIYLWHMPMAAWGIGTPMRFLFGGFNWYYYVATYLVGSALLGILMASLIEYPVLRYRDRWCPSRSRPLTTENT